MLQFLPMIMSLLQSKQKDAEAQKQNEISALMGKAPTAEGGNMGSALGQGMSSMLQQKPGPGQGALDTISGKKGGSTDSMLDSAMGSMGKHSEPDMEPDNDEDDKDLMGM